uniref:Protein kinase domain-containing protein n=1 Tax=Daphnia galeata TaxID=27404 RepID=A0A8J2RZV0_9CRUS|nr:unnamed protein product [Daphnia galeata]
MKWADFGHSKQINDSGCASMSGTRGTQNWLAPEIIPFFYKEESAACSSIKSDIFSAGCAFFFFLTKGVHPYGDENENSDNLKNNMLGGVMINQNRLNNGHRAKSTVLRMMKDRLGLKEVISEFKKALSTPREPLSGQSAFEICLVGRPNSY